MSKFFIAISLLLIAGWGLTLWQAGRQEARAEASHPPSGLFVIVEGTRIHYVQKGSGPDLILIHGASGNLRDFTFSLVDQLTDHYRVTVFDRPGLGYSDLINSTGASITQQAARLSAASQQLGIRNPVVLGQSYGGAVALAWAVQHPTTLSALVLLAAPSQTWDTDLPLFYKITSSRLGSAIAVPLITAWVPNRVVEDALVDIFYPQSAPKGYNDAIGSGLTLRRVSLRANARQRARLLSEINDLKHTYGQITVPVELLHGDADTTVGLQIHSVPLARQIPQARLTKLPGVGHMPQHVSQPEVIAAIHRAATHAGLR